MKSEDYRLHFYPLIKNSIIVMKGVSTFRLVPFLLVALSSAFIIVDTTVV